MFVPDNSCVVFKSNVSLNIGYIDVDWFFPIFILIQWNIYLQSSIIFQQRVHLSQLSFHKLQVLFIFYCIIITVVFHWEIIRWRSYNHIYTVGLNVLTRQKILIYQCLILDLFNFHCPFPLPSFFYLRMSPLTISNMSLSEMTFNYTTAFLFPSTYCSNYFILSFMRDSILFSIPETILTINLVLTVPILWILSILCFNCYGV